MSHGATLAAVAGLNRRETIGKIFSEFQNHHCQKAARPGILGRFFARYGCSTCSGNH
jgi:hypothetical protein